MAVTILETLQNAEINFKAVAEATFVTKIGASQLHNAITLLEKGYGLQDKVEPLLEAHGDDVASVPDKE